MKSTKLSKHGALGILCFILISTNIHSQVSDLMDIYQQALASDPIFKAAYANFMAQTQTIAQARAALLPQLTVAAQVASNNMNVYVAGSQGINGSQSYNSTMWNINATQAIFNYQSWALVQQARASVKAAHATFNSAAQNLMLRTAKAYCDILLSRDTLNFAEAKKRANRSQLEQAQQRFKVGLDAITSVYEAKAAYDQSIAQVISAKNNQINKNENLRKLTNNVYEELAPLRNARIPLIQPEPNDVNDWVAVSLRQNYNLFAAKYNLQAAREQIKVQSAAGLPKLGLVANSTHTNNYGGGVDNFYIPGLQKNSSMALALNFPVFQGGLVVANTRQAQFNFQASSEQFEQIYRDVVVNSHISFNTIKDGISKVLADRQTIISRQNSLESTDAQFQVGTRTMVDVVNAQERLFETQEQLATDQYNLINSILNLKYYAGSLNAHDLEEINSWLASTRINQIAPN